MASQAPSSIKAIVGANLAAARRHRNLTQREVAHELETDVMQVSKWERGLHRPSDETLLALAEVLDREFHWFFIEHDTEASAA